jgi:hypothetical protein
MGLLGKKATVRHPHKPCCAKGEHVGGAGLESLCNAQCPYRKETQSCWSVVASRGACENHWRASGSTEVQAPPQHISSSPGRAKMQASVRSPIFTEPSALNRPGSVP